VSCPEGCIEVLKNGTVEMDLEYCKGCGICSKECRLRVISMEREDA
jgi:pyruvate ferredoxin oxidoreductase delta subunit